MKIKVEKPDQKKIDEPGIKRWPTIEKEACRIDWHFDCTEELIFLVQHHTRKHFPRMYKISAGKS